MHELYSNMGDIIIFYTCFLFLYNFVDDGANFFDDQHQGPVSATSSVVRGLTTFASASGSFNIWHNLIMFLDTTCISYAHNFKFYNSFYLIFGDTRGQDIGFGKIFSWDWNPWQ